MEKVISTLKWQERHPGPLGVLFYLNFFVNCFSGEVESKRSLGVAKSATLTHWPAFGKHPSTALIFSSSSFSISCCLLTYGFLLSLCFLLETWLTQPSTVTLLCFYLFRTCSTNHHILFFILLFQMLSCLISTILFFFYPQTSNLVLFVLHPHEKHAFAWW